ncbi:MAG: RDD family protein [Candidatus Hodarchaeota archaeon]
MEQKKINKKVSYGKEIWRSQLYPSAKIDRILGYSLGFFFLVLPIIVTLILQGDLRSFIGGQIIGLLLGLPFIHIGLRTSVSYIVIYENGVTIRKSKPLIFLNRKYYSFDQIVQAEIIGTVKSTSKLIIFLKNLKPYEYKSRWVFNFKEGKNLLLKYKEDQESKIEKDKVDMFMNEQIPDVEYANFLHRLIAWLIDIVIVIIISAIIYSSFIFQIKIIIFRILFAYLIIHIIGFLYFWLQESFFKGQTLGKSVLKLKTVDEKSFEATSMSKYVINNLIKSSILLILDVIIGIIINRNSSQKQIRITQNLSKTLVIKKQDIAFESNKKLHQLFNTKDE